MISVGSMDRLCYVESPTFLNSPVYGGVQNVTYSATPRGDNKVYANIDFRGGRESDDGEQQVGEMTADFYIRYEKYKDTIQPNWRIYYFDSQGNRKYFYIEGISFVDGRHKITKLRAVNKEVE